MLRRPNRSIEVFDISLMAVVTKAMGAFLVIMVLLMPYYSSGPIGEQNAADLAKTIADAQTQLDLAVNKLAQSKPNPDEIAKLLDEALRRLREAQELMARLKRDNDALNAQVKRLEENLDQAEKEVDSLEKQLADLSKITFVAQILNWDCFELQMDLALLPQQTTYTTRNGAEIKNILNLEVPVDGDLSTVTDDNILAAYKEQRDIAPGHGKRFSRSTIYTRMREGESKLLILLLRDKTLKKIGGLGGYALRKSNKTCHYLLSIHYILPDKDGRIGSFDTAEWTTQGPYGDVIALFTVKDGKIVPGSPTADTKSWFDQQVAKAEKIDVSADDTSSRRAGILKAVDAWTVPRDKSECQVLATKATQFQVDAKVYNDKDRAGMAAVMADCNKGDFASAFQKVKAEMRRTIR